MLQVAVTPQPMPPPLPPWVTLPWGVTMLITLALVGGVVVVLLPLMRAFARRIEGKARPDPALLDELDHLRARVSDAEAMQHRLTELEERVDFTERLLAAKHEPRELGR
jgi:hypothetical protein